MKKPNWKKSPHWAEWLAMDWNFEWYWFEEMPYFSIYKNKWLVSDGRLELAKTTPGYMKQIENTLERRP